MSPQPISPDIIGGNEHILLYGKPKTGKTFAALTAPPPIYFLAIGNANEAKTYYSKQFQTKYGSRLKPDDLLIDVGATSQEIKDLAEKAIEDDASGKGPQFATIVVDGATPLTQLQLDVAFAISYDRMGQKDKSALSKLEKYGAVIPHENDWGIAQGIMRRFVSDLRRVEKNIILIAHEYETFSGGGQGTTPVLESVEPWFIGKDRTQMANAFDNVWRMSRASSDSYVARTEAGNSPKGGYSITAGSRVGGILPKDLINPDISEAIAKLQAYAEEVHK